MDKVPMTKAGANQLRAELQQLKSIDLPKVINAIAEARAHGDLKENAEYHAAREQQGFIVAKITAIEQKLANSQVIDIKSIKNSGRVVFGSTVEITNLETEATATYQIVGDDEASVKAGKISVNSPIAKALIGHQVNEEVTIHTPAGEVEYEISAVHYI
jgi:transcription elongation factor GreA